MVKFYATVPPFSPFLAGAESAPSAACAISLSVTAVKSKTFALSSFSKIGRSSRSAVTLKYVVSVFV